MAEIVGPYFIHGVPVGCVFLSMIEQDPAISFGAGVWEFMKSMTFAGTTVYA